MHEVAAALLELAKGIALSIAVVSAGSVALRLLSFLLREIEKVG